MIIGTTERGTFKRCRRMWELSSFNRQGLEPVMGKPALMLGGIIHKTMDTWTQRLQYGDAGEPESVYMELANQTIDDVRTQYLDRVGVHVDESEMQGVYDALHLGLNMIRRYELKWGTPTPDGYELVQTEQTLLAPIPGTEHWECDNGHIHEAPFKRMGNECPQCDKFLTWQPDYLEGTLDALLRSERTGWLFILERKTYGNRPNRDKLQMEDQFLAYYWLLRSAFPDERIGGILYDGMWKRDGSGRIDKDIDECFQRFIIDRTEHEVAEFEQHLTAEALDMHNPSIYINRPWLGCSDCSFERLCTSMSRGEDWEYIRETYYKPRTSGVNVRADSE